MVKALLEWETLDSDQIKDIVAGKPPRPPRPVQAKPTPTPPPSDGGGKAPEPAPSSVESA